MYVCSEHNSSRYTSSLKLGTPLTPYLCIASASSGSANGEKSGFSACSNESSSRREDVDAGDTVYSSQAIATATSCVLRWVR